MTDFEIEGEWMTVLPTDAKLTFLASLSHNLAIAGRNSYEAGGEGLEDPGQLRRINEIQHRVPACMHGILKGEANGEFQRSLARWVLDHRDDAFGRLMAWAWRSTRQHLAD